MLILIDYYDFMYTEMLLRLLYPRGLGNKAIFLKHFEVCIHDYGSYNQNNIKLYNYLLIMYFIIGF